MSKLRNWASFGVGAFLFYIGFFAFIGQENFLGVFATTIVGVLASYILAFGGIFICLDSLSEYLVSTSIFLITVSVGSLVFMLGIVTILHEMGKVELQLNFISPIMYHILFMLEGVFLMIACFVME